LLSNSTKSILKELAGSSNPFNQTVRLQLQMPEIDHVCIDLF